MEPSLSPHDCSLAVALPLTREEFLADLAASPTAGYAATFASDGRKGLPDSTLWDLFEPWAKVANQVISEVQACGVIVARRATLSDFLALLQRFKVTTLFAHWHTPQFTEAHIVDPDTILQALRDKSSLFAMRVEQLQTLRSSPAGRPSPEAGKPEIVSFLNLLIMPEEAPAGVPGGTTQQQTEWHKRRKFLEQALPRSFQGGAGIDFADGWHSLDSIVAAVPESYSGTLDLTVCNANVLAEEIRLKCPNAVVPANEDQTTTGFRFAFYAETIHSLSRWPGGYEATAAKLRGSLFARKPMKNINKVLAEYSAGPVQGAAGKRRAFDPANLIADLRAVRNSSKKYFIVCVAMLLVLFTGGCVLVLTLFHQPSQIKIVFSGLGFSLMGVFYQMTRLWKEKILSDILIVLAASLDPTQTKQVVEIILRKLKP